jgi:hypothetical protein
MENEFQNQNQEKEKFDIENIPFATRKLILVVSIFLVMSVIVAGWLLALRSELSAPVGGRDQDKLQGVGEELKNFLAGIKTEVADIKEKTAAVLATTTEAEILGQADLSILKEKLQARETAGWQEYRNRDYHFLIKYPASLRVDTAAADRLVAFGPLGTSTDWLVIKKFGSYNNFVNLIGLKKSWPREGYYIVALDYADNTTTRAMINNFKFIENNL